MLSEQRPAGSDLLLRLGRTTELEATELRRVRELLELSFEADFTEADWEHALGGVHVMAWRGETLVGHASVVERHLLCGGRALRTGYVEAVAVHPAHRRRGIAERMMHRLELVIVRDFELGALSASDAAAALYRKRGWQLWVGPLSAATPRGLTPTPEEQGGVYVLPVAQQLDLSQPLTADFRDGDIW
jgi:aminoglycoside 2'-N-acetyltransferase I